MTRKAIVELIYEGVDITKYITEDNLEFSYTDNASGTADDISFRIKDLTGKWMSSWAPIAGEKIKPTIVTTDWNQLGDTGRLECGEFMVDQISYAGPPDTANIGAISIPANTEFRDADRSRTWQSANIKKIAQTICNTYGLKLFFDSKVNPIIGFIEQNKVSDSSFLCELCSKYGLSMKLYKSKIVIFSEAEYEAKAPVAVILKNESYKSDTETLPQIVVEGWDAVNTLTETGYDGCKIAYTNLDNGATLSYTFKPKGSKGRKILKLNETADSYSQAQCMAKAALRDKNKKERTMTANIPGNLLLFGGQTVKVLGFGRFDGKYFIDVISRSVAPFKANIQLHKTLEGY